MMSIYRRGRLGPPGITGVNAPPVVAHSPIAVTGPLRTRSADKHAALAGVKVSQTILSVIVFCGFGHALEWVEMAPHS